MPPQMPRSAETSIDSAASRQGCLTGQVMHTSMARRVSPGSWGPVNHSVGWSRQAASSRQLSRGSSGAVLAVMPVVVQCSNGVDAAPWRSDPPVEVWESIPSTSSSSVTESLELFLKESPDVVPDVTGVRHSHVSSGFSPGESARLGLSVHRVLYPTAYDVLNA